MKLHITITRTPAPELRTVRKWGDPAIQSGAFLADVEWNQLS